MRVVMFYHSLISDWNHGNAHFLRGVASELQRRGHDVRVFEPEDAWSANQLEADQGPEALAAYRRAYPDLESRRYGRSNLDVGEVLDGADLVIVHEWNDADLITRVGQHRARTPSLRALFHDTHHRSVSDQGGLAACDLRHYDGVLAFGRVIRVRYLSEGWSRQAWTWHEAADIHVFQPVAEEQREGDLVWIGNWGDGERADELQEFLIEPVARLGLRATVYGVRYPAHAVRALADAGIAYRGWLPNSEAPRVFARHAMTVHVPRRPYVNALPGIPTIRPFEAMACGIPLVSAPWDDVEGLFNAGSDYLIARDSAEMTRHLSHLRQHPDEAAAMATRARRTILSRHTCAHRVDELLAIHAELQEPVGREVQA
jgi:spore maturation protein CgeB